MILVYPPFCGGDVDTRFFPSFVAWILVGFYGDSAVSVAVCFYFYGTAVGVV